MTASPTRTALAAALSLALGFAAQSTSAMTSVAVAQPSPDAIEAARGQSNLIILRTGIFDLVALLVALTVGTACITYGFKTAHGQTHDGVPAGMDFFLGFVILLAAGGDIRMLVRGGISGAQRIARHLWRMCFGLFVASGSFFLGRQRIFPEFVRKSNVLIFLTILPLILLIFWLIRVRFTNLYRGKPLPQTGEVSSGRT